MLRRSKLVRSRRPRLIPVEQDEYAMLAADVLGSGLWFYCRKCKMKTDPAQLYKRYEFRCQMCGTDVAFGTEKSIRNYYRLPS